MKSITLLVVLFILFSSCSKSDDDFVEENEENEELICQVAPLSFANNVAFPNPCGISIAGNGTLAITTYNGFDQGYGSMGVTKLWSSYASFAQGANPLFETNNTAAEAVVFDPDLGHMYIAETEQVAGIAVYLNVIQGYQYSHTIQGGFVNPRGLAVDSTGKLYIADDGNGRIMSVAIPSNPSSPILTEYTGLNSVKGIAFSDSHLYYTNFIENKVGRISLTSGVKESVSVVQPIDIHIDQEAIYVSSYTTGKLHVFSTTLFSGECENVYENLTGSFAMTSIPDIGLLTTNHDKNAITILNIEN
ncbi:MAG: hypothetical protein H0X63_04215 [Flavobacteriales bacterium]|nr:hypothetical protein [Flavobacteriales bacterium]